MAVVRRPTGGRAVLHWQEVTFCLTIPTMRRSLWDIFKTVHEGIGCGLNLIGIPAKVLPVERDKEDFSGAARSRASSCFASPSKYELMLNDKKIAGSAQRKYGEFMLIHGSIPILPNYKSLFGVLEFPDEDLRNRAYKKALRKMTTLYDEMGKRYTFKELANAITEGFKTKWNCSMYEDEFSNYELELMNKLEVEKYGARNWLERK